MSWAHAGKLEAAWDNQLQNGSCLHRLGLCIESGGCTVSVMVSLTEEPTAV